MLQNMALKQRSYCHAPRKRPFIGVTVGQKLYMAAEQYPTHEMYVFCADNERKTFKQMKEESIALAASLLSLGLQKGDRLAILGNNHSEWLVVLLACMQIGVIVVNPRLQFSAETQHAILKKMCCKGLFLTRSPQNLMETVKDIMPDIEDNKQPQNLNIQSLPDLRFVIVANPKIATNSVCYSLESVLSRSSDSLRSQVVDTCRNLDADDPCVVYFTSGTTGSPKGVVHSHHALLNSAASGFVYRLDVEGFKPDWDTKYAMTMSFAGASSSFGVLLPIISPKSTSVIAFPSYNKESLAQALEDERCTDVVMFIHHLSDLVSLPNLQNYDLSSLKAICVTGSIIPSALRRKLKQLAPYVTNQYGATEMFGIHLSHPLDPVEVLDSAAVYPTGGTEVKIVNDKGETVPVNTRGEICVRSYAMFKFYWMDEERTKEAKDDQGWWHTSDLGVMNEKGYFRVLGRNSDLIIIREAINVTPIELEAVLYEHEDVQDALVVGIPDERSYGEVCACIKTKKPCTVNEGDIRKFCEGKVSTLLMPKYVLFVEGFPTTDTGKFHRRRMAEEARRILNLSPHT